MSHPDKAAGAAGGCGAAADQSRRLEATESIDPQAAAAPLQELMEKHIDERFLKRIAVEHARGRILWIGTTNLEAQRPVPDGRAVFREPGSENGQIVAGTLAGFPQTPACGHSTA